jgi:hypothetical protein
MKLTTKMPLKYNQKAENLKFLEFYRQLPLYNLYLFSANLELISQD